MNYVEKIVVDVKTLLGGDKEIHFMGYSYYNDYKDKPYTFVEYCGFTELYSIIVERNYSVRDYEKQYGEYNKQYCQDCTIQELNEIYEHYDNGRCPKFIEDIDENTPDGMYIL